MSIEVFSARRLIVLSLSIVFVGSLVASGSLSKQEPIPKIPTDIPLLFSQVKTLEIVSARIINENTPAAGVSVEVRNNSHKAVMAVDLVSGDGAVTKNGLTDEDNPIVVIEPYGTTTLEMTFGEMTPGAPLIVSAATYADGTEEGDAKSLEAMHLIRKRDKARLYPKRIKGGL